MLIMKQFKNLTFLVLAIVFLFYEGSAQPNRRSIKIVEKKRKICLNEIKKYFPGATVFDHAKYAMENYSLRSTFDEGAVYACSYYQSFEKFLLEGEIITTNEFCDKYPEPEECERIVNNRFTNDKAYAVNYAFYRITKENMMKNIGTTLEPVYDYFNIILNGFRMNTDGFLNPELLCESTFKLRDIPNEVDDEDENIFSKIRNNCRIL